MKVKSNKTDSQTKKPIKDEKGFGSLTIYIFLICGFIIIAIGIWLTLKNETASGVSQPGRYGQGGGTKINLSGLAVICIGSLFLLFPLYDLIQCIRRKL